MFSRNQIIKREQDSQMSFFADIHLHMLYGTDDGPKSPEQMTEMFDAAYAAGTRFFCLTPHFHLGLFGDNRESSETAFTELLSYAHRRDPELIVLLGNELRYGPAAVSWLDRGLCRTMNRTRVVLVDFQEDETESTVKNAMYRLLNAGYRPILAHAERYHTLSRSWSVYEDLKSKGVKIQINGNSLFGQWDRSAKQMSRQLLKRGLVDLICSDAHNTESRPPELQRAYGFVSDRYGADCARRLFFQNAVELLTGKQSIEEH